MSLLALAYLLLDRPMQQRFESDPLFQATTLLLAGARAASHGAVYSRTSPKSSDVAPRRRRSGGAGARASPPRHAVARSAAAVQRPLSRDDHQRRRRLQPLERPGGHALARRRHLRQLGHLLLPPRRCDSGEFWSAALSADAASRPTATRRSSRRRAPSSAAATTASTRTPRSPSRPKTTSSCGASRITNRSRVAQDDRSDQLRRGGAGPGGRRRAASRVQQPVRADRDPARRSRRSSARAGRARRDEQPPWMCHLMTVHGATVGDGVATRPTACGSSAAATRVANPQAMTSAAPLSDSDGRGARSDRRDPPRSRARAERDRARSTS